MEKYYSYGGASNPNFRHKVYVKKVSDHMVEWCQGYGDNQDPFCRYYIKYATWPKSEVEDIEFQFEQEKPAVLFALHFGGR
jgi:hypothetical protein